MCAVIGRSLGEGETRKILCRNGTVGRFITIRRNTDTRDTLQLCEVEVYGSESKSVKRNTNKT